MTEPPETAPTTARRSSGNLLNIVLTALLIAVASYGVFVLWSDLQAQRKDDHHRLEESSRLVAERTNQYFRRWETVFAALNETECLKTRKAAPCDDLFAKLNQRFPEIVNFAAAEGDGSFFATGKPMAGKDRPNVRHLKFFKELAAGRPRYLMDPHIGPLSGQLVSGLSVPLRDAQGRFNGLIGFSTRFSNIEALWSEAHPYGNVHVLVLNAEGKVIYSPAGYTSWLGRKAADLGMKIDQPALPESVSFQVGADHFDGHITPVGPQEWRIVALRPVSSLWADYRDSHRNGAHFFLPVALLTLLGGVLALRAQRARERAELSETRLQANLNKTEEEVQLRTRQLNESELRFRALFEESPNGILAIDTRGRILEFNRAAAALLGYTEAEFTDLSIRDIEGNEDEEATRQHLERIARNGHDSFETRLRCKTGHLVDMLINVRHIQLSTGPVSIGVWTDLTPITKILQLQKRLQTIVETSRDGMLIADDSGRLIYVNPAIEQLLGWPKQSLQGKNIDELIPPDQRNTHHEGLLRANGSQKRIRHETREIEALHRDGIRIPMEMSLATWNEGDQTLYSAVLRDLTERKQAQDRLQFTQKMEAVGILAGGIAHDFNNLLAIMLGHSQLIFDRSNETDPNRASAEKINRAVVKARSLIKQLLDFSRATDEAPKVLSLADELKEVEGLIRASVPRQIELRISNGTLGAIRAVPHQMQQVFINLINNACDAIGSAHGIVEVRLTEETIRNPIQTADGTVLPGHYVMACVFDNGPGISESIHDRIFLPFFTTKDVGRGTGLGLAVVRNIVHQSGGQIRVFNRLSGGACFEIYFPRVDAQPAAEDERPPERSGQGESIVFVDDEPEVVEAYALYLNRMGYKARVIDSAQTALQELAAHPDTVDLVISDLIMPHMDGLEFSRALYRSLPDLPILLLTGRGERVTVEQMAQAGIKGLISKPAEPRLIGAEIQRVLDKHHRTRS